MLLARARRGRRQRVAFTLIELIVVIVVAGLLASIAAVSYQQVVSNTQLKATEAKLAQLSREAQALAVLAGHSTVTAEDIRTAGKDVSSVQAASFSGADRAGQVLAAQQKLVVVLGRTEFSPSARTVHASLDGSAATLGLAMWVPNVGCSLSFQPMNGSVHTWSDRGMAQENCSGLVAVDPQVRDHLQAPPTPAGSLTWSDSVATVHTEADTDIYRDGQFIGSAGADGTFTDPNGARDAIYTYVSRAAGTPAGIPSTWAGAPATGAVGQQAPTTSVAVVSVTWNASAAPAGTTSFDVQRHDPVTDTWSTVGTATTGGYVDRFSPPGATYQVIPKAGSAPSGAAMAAAATATPAPTPVGEQAPPSLTWNATGARVGWNAVPNTATAPLTGYRLYRTLNGGPVSTVFDGTETSFDDQLSTGQQVCYQVSAYGPGGESAKSPARCGTMPERLPGAAGTPVGTVANAKVVLSWAAPTTGATPTGYIVQTRVGTDGATTDTPTGSSHTAFTKTGLTNGSGYTFRVAATTAAGPGDWSAWSPLYVPAASSASFSYTGAATSWTVPDGVTSVQVTAVGAAGGGSTGPGKGARVTTTLTVTPGQVFAIRVGGRGVGRTGGWNGGGLGGIGGNGAGNGGGGMTDIYVGGSARSNAVVVAGGGGGSSGSAYAAGNGGEEGTAAAAAGGKGGTGTAGGAGGIGQKGGTNGMPGTAGAGGEGAGWDHFSGRGGGGGGGGWFGGGGGGSSYITAGNGGGGGSSYVAPGAIDTLFSTVAAAGHGSLLLQY